MSLFGELMQGSSKVWENEAEALHPFHHLAQLSPEVRVAEVSKHVLKAVPKVVAALVLMIGEEKFTKSELDEKEDPGGKFGNKLVLCNSKIFQLGEFWFRSAALLSSPDCAATWIADWSVVEFSGLEVLIGYPQFSSDKAILEDMAKEHNKVGHAYALDEEGNGTEKFTAWNAEEKRETT
jgi:hypothetical protein